MASANQLSPRPRSPACCNRLSGWLSRRFRRTNKLRATNPVEAQQPLSEESPSSVIAPDNKTIIPSNPSYRRPSLWRRFFRRRHAREGSNLGFDFGQVEPERGFSPPRHRQPEWMRQCRDDEGRVSESSILNNDIRIKDAGRETEFVGAELKKNVGLVWREDRY